LTEKFSQTVSYSLNTGYGINDFIFRIGEIMWDGNRWGVFGHSISRKF
jgi:hypothetical protein